MLSLIKKSPLFFNMTEEEIENCITYSQAEIVDYAKNEIVFHQQAEPEKLHMLLSGSIMIGNDSISGKRNLIAIFNGAGDLFGEVFLFLNKDSYENYAQAVEPSKVLQIPKAFFYYSGRENNYYQTKLISNMMMILAEKAYYLNKKIHIITSATLRQKIVRLLLQTYFETEQSSVAMNREEMADFLNVARPSLSRELMKMQEDGLIKIKGKRLILTDFEQLKNVL